MKVWTRRPGAYAGKQRDFGEVFDLPDGSKREQLLRLGYLEKSSGRSSVKCGDCGAGFIGDAERNMHGRKRHQGRLVESMIRDLDDLSPQQIAALNESGRKVKFGEHYMPPPADDLDVQAQEDEKFLAERAPLYLDKTAASRK